MKSKFPQLKLECEYSVKVYDGDKNRNARTEKHNVMSVKRDIYLLNAALRYAVYFFQDGNEEEVMRYSGESMHVRVSYL